MKVGFYRGCCFQGLDFILFDVIKRIMKVLDVELPEVKETTCCGGNVIDEESRLLTTLINARNIAAAEKRNLDLLISCNTCFMTIERAKRELENNEKLFKKINSILEGEEFYFSGKAKLWHLLPFLTEKIGFEKIKKHVKKKISLKVAPYYGCHIKYPHNITKEGSLEKLIEICGGTIIRYKEEDTCCGYHAIYTDKSISLKKIEKIIDSAIESGAEVMVTPCPLCFKAFDLLQNETKVTKKLPVLFVPELIALSFGFNKKESGTFYHKIEVKI